MESKDVEAAIAKAVEVVQASNAAQLEKFEAMFSSMSVTLASVVDNAVVPDKAAAADNDVADVKVTPPVFVGGGKGAWSVHSVNSQDEDVKVINDLIKPEFYNKDAQAKIDFDNLRTLQKQIKGRIPTLEMSEVTDPNSHAAPLHNYGAWYRGLMSYFLILSPALYQQVRGYVQSINVDELMSGYSNVEVPELDENDFPLVIRLAAFGAIMDSLSDYFKDFIETDLDGVTQNLFMTLKALSVFCSPNSQADRSNHIAQFWSSTHGQDECLTHYQRRMEKMAREINDQYAKAEISHEQLYAATISGVTNGGQFAAYQLGLSMIKMTNTGMKNDIKSRILWLFTMCEKEKLPQSYRNVANMARTRGGRGGKGRGGKGRGGKGKGPQVPVAGGAVWKDNVYLVADPSGETQVTKEIKARQSNQICFTFCKNGKCAKHERGECPFNHEFKVVDTRPKPSAPVPRTDLVPAMPVVSNAVDSASLPTPNVSDVTHKITNSSVNIQNDVSAFSRDETNSIDSAFDYSKALGFHHSSSAAILKTDKPTKNCKDYIYSKLPNTTTIYNTSEIIFMTWFSCCSLPYLCANSFVFLCSCMSFSLSLFYLSVSCLTSCFSLSFYLLNLLILFFIQPMKLVTQHIIDVTNITGLYINNIIFYNLSSLLTSTVTCLTSPSFPIFGFLIGVAIVYYRMENFTPYFTSAASVRRSVYQIILDCGCSFTMSGDYGLFIHSTLTPINESVMMAESGNSVKATHKGKMVVDGKAIDALYVPDFKQTMISMGQLERMGLVYTRVSENTRSFLTDRGDVFMSFFVAPNNLYPLLPTSQSASSGIQSS